MQEELRDPISLSRLLFLTIAIIALAACGSSDSEDEDETTTSEGVWFVDNRSAGGTGSEESPFSTLAEAQLAAMSGDTIYISSGDGSSSGLDTGLILNTANVTVIGSGVEFVFNGTTLPATIAVPNITNATGAGIVLNSADNTIIRGLNITGVGSSGLVVNDSTGVVLEQVIIGDSGESAILGGGTDVELTLTEVTIQNVDLVDPGVSDDAINIMAANSSSLVMNGGVISGVPGNLGNAIALLNPDATSPVEMNLDIRGVNISNIGQDGIKLENKNGVMNVQIGGPSVTDGNTIDAGFRGIQIRTGADPALNRSNTLLLQNNNILSNDDSIQIRSVSDTVELAILDNVVTRGLAPTDNSLIDVQSELLASGQVRINRNTVTNTGGRDGIKMRVFDAADLVVEILNNNIDGPDEGFDFDVIETDSAAVDTTRLNVTVLDNILDNIGNQAMNARNADATSETCLDLQRNSVIAQLYALDALVGSFSLDMASQPTDFDPVGGSINGAGPCIVPAF